MAIFRVQIGVATARPPRHDADAVVMIEADTATEARQVSLDMLMWTRKIVMPVKIDIEVVN